MLTEIRAGPYTVRGISVGGVYTSLQVPELGVVLDAGIPLRSFAGTDHLFLSHGHADHAAALGALLGIRVLIGKPRPPKVYFPAEIEAPLAEALAGLGRLHHTDMRIDAVPLRPGETWPLGHDVWVRAFRTHHRVPSLAYQFLRRVPKLRPEYHGLPAQEVARLRRAGEDLFEESERLELAYVTDTLAHVLDTAPALLESRVLILECTFVDGRRTVLDAQERSHVHLDEIVARAERFQCEALVLMHFSQSHSPEEVQARVRERMPAALGARVIVFAPERGRWFG
ncbi:MAG: MBL fold metallo-hydrolase [Myxococcaceae bacterium]|nr:MBL fold metallo-hydrolase [Myxococcaceae bacterium]